LKVGAVFEPDEPSGSSIAHVLERISPPLNNLLILSGITNLIAG